MRVVSVALLATVAAFGCHKQSGTSSAAAQNRLQSQEVQWQETGAPAQPAIAVEQLAVDPPVVRAGQSATVTVRLANVHPGTEITLSWFGPNGWNVTDQEQPATGNTLTFRAPAFDTPGRYQAELRNDVQLLATTSVTVQ